MYVVLCFFAYIACLYSPCVQECSILLEAVPLNVLQHVDELLQVCVVLSVYVCVCVQEKSEHFVMKL